jgi:cyclopropane-fatty-acyl-phospholipid synthase
MEPERSSPIPRSRAARRTGQPRREPTGRRLVPDGPPGEQAPEGVAAVARRALARMADGRLADLPFGLRFWDATELPSRRPGPSVVLRDPAALAHQLYAPGQLGLARAWVNGLLTVDGDLESVLRGRGAFAEVRLSWLDRARLALAALRLAGAGALRRPPVPKIEAHPTGRRRSLTRDRTAVRHHYDVSNRFYRLVLGPSMVYSCGYFDTPDDTLEAAQERKLALICRKLALRQGERLLDIGCGWGSLVIHAARYGVAAVGITLSEPQAELARERADEAGVGDRVEIRVQDYRELADERFDKIASVGMYEHVGRDQLGRYVGAVVNLLRPGGLFLNHGIARLAAHRPEADPFISRYVFPDGELHPVTDVASAMQTAGLEIRDVESLREHYPLTLRRWVANLAANREAAIADVGPERERVWRLYMLGSALGFEAGEIGVYQVLAASPGPPHGLPLSRRGLLEPDHPPRA